jgi:type IV pilus assembly protein PilB
MTVNDMQVQPQRLKAFMLDANLITDKEFEKAYKKAKKTRKNLEDILVAEKLISQDKLIKLEAYILGIPFINLEKETIPPEILKIIPEPIACSHNIVAFRKSGQELEVAMLDPEDLKIIEFIRKKADLKILPRLTTPEGIKNVLRQYHKTLKAEFGDIIKKQAQGLKPIKLKKGGENVEDQKELKKVAEELPIIKIVDTLIRHAVLQRASDIHIETMEKQVVVRYRIDGILRDAMTLPKFAAQGIVARIKVLSDLRLDEHRLPQDGRFKIETNEYKYSMRVSILPVFKGEKIVMRLLSEGSKAYTLEEMGLRGSALEDVEINIKKPTGMILVTGPTGSGKTTTLYAILELLNTPDVNISTLEDPIEYRMPRINQTQVNAKIGLTFSNGLRSLVRQDPDIIMVGEIRDKETAKLAINAALTGHLVLSTLHTTNAAGVIPRLIDMGVEPFLISSTLNVILAQRLVRKLCPEKEKYALNQEEIKNIEKYCDLGQVARVLIEQKIIKSRNEKIMGKNVLEDINFYRPIKDKKEECPQGYKGRIGIYEVLPITQPIKELINKKADTNQIQVQAQNEGMVTMTEDGFVKAAQGITSIEEVLRVIIE